MFCCTAQFYLHARDNFSPPSQPFSPEKEATRITLLFWKLFSPLLEQAYHPLCACLFVVVLLPELSYRDGNCISFDSVHWDPRQFFLYQKLGFLFTRDDFFHPIPYPVKRCRCNLRSSNSFLALFGSGGRWGSEVCPWAIDESPSAPCTLRALSIKCLPVVQTPLSSS